MANRLTGRIWEVDTAGVLVAKGLHIAIQSIAWVGGTTIAHTVNVQNANCDTIWRSVAQAANFVDRDWFENPLALVNGLQVSQMSSGKLYIVLEAG